MKWSQARRAKFATTMAVKRSQRLLPQQPKGDPPIFVIYRGVVYRRARKAGDIKILED